MLVHHARDELGSIQVIDTHGVRSLHFGTKPRQSALALAEPDRIELVYLRAMLTTLVFNPAPRRALILGLGGGSLARFLLSHFPGIRIDAVELRSLVAEIATTYFGLPRSPRLAVHIGDCAAHLKLAVHEPQRYDHIYLDAFDHAGLAASAAEPFVIEAAARLLSDTGVFAMNLWGNQNEAFRQVSAVIDSCFSGRGWQLRVPGRGNVIAFATPGDVPPRDQRMMRERAVPLERRFDIEFSRFAPNLARIGRQKS